MILLDFNTDGINQAIANVAATELEARKALNSTMGKMAAWMRTQSVRGLSTKLKIQQKILRARFMTFRMQGALSWATSGDAAKVWYGLNDIPLSRLNPRQTAKGVSAMGGRFVEGAFIAKVRGRPQVLKRVGKGRLPLVGQYATVHEPAIAYIDDFVLASAAFDRRFIEIFERELKWRTSTRS